MTKFYNTISVLLLLSCLTACGKGLNDPYASTPKGVAKLSSICTSHRLEVITLQPNIEYGIVRVKVYCYDKTTNLQYSP